MLADSLSRFKPLSTEWQLETTLISCVRLHWLLPTSVNLFATCRNTQLPRFLLPFPDNSAVGVEALSHPWDFPGMMYVFLSTPLLTAVLGRIRDSLRSILLLAPAWPRQLWYSYLIELSIVHAVCLPLNQFPLLQGNWIHSSSQMVNIHAWTLEGKLQRAGIICMCCRFLGSAGSVFNCTGL